eukprot:COSAG02_NODE_4289_length_5540_cov_40.610101_5_plen_105_part_00
MCLNGLCYGTQIVCKFVCGEVLFRVSHEMLQVGTSHRDCPWAWVPIAIPVEKFPLEAFPGTKLDVPRLPAPRGPARGRAREPPDSEFRELTEMLSTIYYCDFRL